MSKKTNRPNGQPRVLSKGTWEITEWATGEVLGRLRAIDEGKALRKAARMWGVPADRLEALAVLPTVFTRNDHR